MSVGKQENDFSSTLSQYQRCFSVLNCCTEPWLYVFSPILWSTQQHSFAASTEKIDLTATQHARGSSLSFIDSFEKLAMSYYSQEDRKVNKIKKIIITNKAIILKATLHYEKQARRRKGKYRLHHISRKLPDSHYQKWITMVSERAIITQMEGKTTFPSFTVHQEWQTPAPTQSFWACGWATRCFITTAQLSVAAQSTVVTQKSSRQWMEPT